MINRIIFNLCILLASASVSLANTTASGQFVEQGRFGAGVASTSDGVQFLAMYEGEDFEVHFQTDAGWDYIVPHSNEQSGDVGVTLRGGKRFNIGDFNYIAVGAHVYKPFFNQTEGVNGPVNFMVGPYVALQRSFRGSHLMLTAWVLPVSYASMAEDLVHGTTDFERVNSVGWFKDGGIGITYLF